MGVYIDEARWNRDHGPSGHMVGDTIEELHEMAMNLDLPSTNFLPFAMVPHYQLPACEQKRAIASGAIKLDRHAFRKVTERIHASLQINRIGEATLHNVLTDKAPSRRRRRRRGTKKKQNPQIQLL